MSLEVVTLVQEPLQTNTYLIADTTTQTAAVIDPSFEAQVVLNEASQRGWTLRQIWLTHGHFDHIAGAAQVANAFKPPLLVGLHPADLELWAQSGGAEHFGFKIETGPEPTIMFYQGQILNLGQIKFLVRHTPGHTRGSVIFYCPEAHTLFCGDLLFKNGVGRTDMPGGSFLDLKRSIRAQVMTLADDIRLLPGHGEETTVGAEKKDNPFLKGTAPI